MAKSSNTPTSSVKEVLRLPPNWLRNGLQGLAFWIGHRCSIYSDWELSEGALVGELCSLIHAHLGDDYSLRCERPFTQFVPAGVKSPGVGDMARVDLSVWKSETVDGQGRRSTSPRYAIEIKRAKAAKGKIDADLRRLATIVENSNRIRGILCIASEKHLPSRFVNKKGFRRLGVFPIPDTQCSYQVIAVAKASAYLNLKNINKAHYCCAVEVLPNYYIEEQQERYE
ncbi:MAG: hypothetical protein E6R08_04885 [Nevskiaceae bacterium]|nr:MAG: hypothetical protein E6R08_04885 [Nevskiaceae bacterium]